MAASSRLSHRGGSDEDEFLDKGSTTTKDGSCQKVSRVVKTLRKISPYRHVPHSQKPPHLVQRRNARERRRVQAVNGAFLRLRKHVPYEPKHKRLSKVKTLRVAIDYIKHLEKMIAEHDQRSRLSRRESVRTSYVHAANSHNDSGRGWINTHNALFTEPRRRYPRLANFPPMCQQNHPNTYLDNGGPLV